MGTFEDHIRLYETAEGWRMDIVNIPAPHPQVLPFLKNYIEVLPGVSMDYRRADNQAGHGQRGFIVYWGLAAFLESNGIPFVDVGSAGVQTFGGISTDIRGNGDRDNYNGTMNGVCIKADAANLAVFQDGSLSAVIGNHIGEHISCSLLKGNEDWIKKKQLACKGLEIRDVIKNEWLRVLRPGGYIAMVIPDEYHATKAGTSVFLADTEHQHAWTAQSFKKWILQPLIEDGLVTLEEFDTLDNHFSFNFCVKKL